ncbi:MAG TPA: rhodanese-like domain-containing protein [Bacteroidales bacterium]|nr:rhodanese-like domain-containing protein [Bacteroidales bacterium]
MMVIMKRLALVLFMVLFCMYDSVAQDYSLEKYILNYDYESRKEMKINSEQLVSLLKENKAQLIDIRFAEEYNSWNMPFAISIPLPDLPNNLDKIDKSKIIVTACPHKDRAIIAMTYLKTKGYQVKYLTDGLLGLADYLRGDQAKDFMNEIR